MHISAGRKICSNLPLTWLLLFAVIAATASAVAQLSSASVNGTVRDVTGAVVPAAQITLRNVDTNVTRTTVSNGAGNYLFPSIPPGHYTLQFTSPGFQSQSVNPFEVAVDQVITLNPEMKVGDVSSAVTIEAQGIQVESSSASLGAVIGEKEVTNLPLNGRNFTQLLQLTPGATPISVGQNSSGGNTASTQGSAFTFPSINGQPNRATMYLVDGINDNNAWYNTYAVAPVVDSVQEFKINSHNDAQYGQVTGGVVNVTTKSGSNTYHGAAWDYIRNNAFDANTFFNSPSIYHQNQFGGTLGGPISIPHVYNGKDKTFFFVAAEGLHYSRSNDMNILQPTAAQLGKSSWGGPQTSTVGDFGTGTTGVAGCSSTTATSAAKCQLYDPTVNNTGGSRPAFVGNQIPVSKMDPRSIRFLEAVFSAPIAIPGISPTVANGQITSATRQTQYNYSGRIDQHIGTRDFVYFRYAGEQLETISPSTIPHLFNDNTLPAQQYGASWLHIFNPSTSLQVQYGRSHVEYNTTTTFDIPNIVDQYGVSSAYASSYVGGVTLMPSLALTGYFSGGEVNSPASNLSSIHQYLGNFIKTFGNHQFQAGGGWDQINYTQVLRYSTVTFSGATTGNFANNPGSTVSSANASTQSGNGLASFLLNYPDTELKRNVNITERPGGIASLYLQDTWKVTPALTFNYGIRYDRTVIPQYGTDGSVGQQGSIETGDFDFHTGDYIIQQLPPACSDRGHAPCIPGNGALPAHVRVATGKKILEGTKTNFGPRFGIAYRVNSNLALRGGFGITFDNWAASIQLPQNYQGSWPDIGTQELDNTNTPGTAYTSAQNPFGASSGNLPAATPFLASNVNYFVDPSIKNPYSEQWNLGLEQQLGRTTILSLNYVGSESHRLDLGGYYNTGTPAAGTSFAARQAAGTTGQPFPYTVPNRWDHHGGNGTYNSLQALLSRRFTSGLGYTVAYTWSKAIDEGQSGWFGVEGNGLQDPYNPRGSRSVSAYDIPHLISVGANYELPFGSGKKFSTGNRILDYAVGSWQVHAIFVARSGQPFSVNAAGDIANTGNGGTYERANLVGDPHLQSPTRFQWFNTAAFATPASGTLGSSGRNILRTQRFWDLDTSVSRSFPIHESIRFDLQAQAFNTANHPVLGTPASTITTPSSFGQITTVVGNQRLLQFSGKLSF